MKPRPHILMYMQSYYSNDLHRGVAQYALEAGWSLNTSMYRSGVLPNRRWDGVIGSFVGQDDFYDQVVRPQGIPAVSLTETDAMPCVLPDNRAIGTLAAEHLIELGYKNFAFYFWQSKLHERQRAEAFEARLNPEVHRFFKINAHPTPRERRQSMVKRIDELRRQLKRLPKPVAIFAPMDDLAVEIVDLCVDLGLKIPQEVGVLGVNNDSLICDFAPVSVSSVDNDEYKIGYEGAALLARLMQGQPTPGPVTLVAPKSVAVRKSTDLLEITAAPDSAVAVAVRFIAEHFREGIDTDRVAQAAGLSKRSLQDRFFRHVGRTVFEQIQRKRIDHAKQLLRGVDNKTAFIAEDSGFGSRERFSKAFKQATGTNPVEYRAAQLQKETARLNA